MPINRRIFLGIVSLACTAAIPALGANGKPVDSNAFKLAAETLRHTRDAFYIPDKHLYREEINSTSKNPSWTWDASIQLGALCAAARIQPATYLPQARAYAVALRTYRTNNHGKPGLDVNPAPKPPDRYYDDNAWISMSLLDTYALTKDPKDLMLAKECYTFATGCEDDKLGGGLYWHEDVTKSKNACTSGPSMLAALQLYRLTTDETYLRTAIRLYEWQRKTLQDKDGLVSDKISMPDGKISDAKLTYNSGTLIRASAELFQATKDQKYLDEAERVADAAAKRFVHKDGPNAEMIEGWGKLAVKLVEGFAAIYEVDHNERWRDIISTCVSGLSKLHNAEGFFPLNWDKEPLADKATARLIDQACVARAYLIAAEAGIEIK